jgi:hypothetical protein
MYKKLMIFLLSIFLISFSSAFINTTFSNGLTSEMFRLNGTSPSFSAVRYLQVPNTVSIFTNARLNVSGNLTNSSSLYLGGVNIWSYPNVTMTQILEGIRYHYSMDNTGGYLVNDTLGVYNGSSGDAISWGTGKVGNGIIYNTTGASYTQINQSISNIDQESKYSIAFWVKAYPQGADYDLYSEGANWSFTPFFALRASNGGGGTYRFLQMVERENGGIISTRDLDTAIVFDNTWHHVVWTNNNGVYNYYVDGSLNKSGTYTKGTKTLGVATIGRLVRYNCADWACRSIDANGFNGTLDEFTTWNRILNGDEVAAIYNNSYGLNPYKTSKNFSNYKTSDFSSVLTNYLSNNCTYISGFCYVPFYFNDNVESFMGYSNLFVSNTGSVFSNAQNETEVYETSSQTFSIDYYYDSSFYPIVSASIVYNNTYHTATKVGTGNNITFTATFDIPEVDKDMNKSWFWEITRTNSVGDSIDYYPETAGSNLNQSVLHINMTQNCSGDTTVRIANFTAYSESTLARINQFKFDGTISYWLGSGSVKKNVSISSTNITEQYLCIRPINKTHYIDAHIRYDNYTSGGYMPREYFIYNGSFDNSTQHIKLFLLEESSSTSFIQFVQDRNYIEVENAYIYVYRYYPGTNSYELVQVSKTDANGKSVGFYKTETVDYKHKIYLNGELVLETNNSKIVPESAPYTLTFIIGESFSVPWTNFEDDSDIQTSLTYNNNSGLITYNFLSVSGTTLSARLLVTMWNNAGADTVICNSTSSSSSGVINCDVSAYNGTITAKGYINNEVKRIITISKSEESGKDTFGKEGLILALLILITAFFAFIWSPTIGIIAVNITFILLNVIGFVTFSPLIIFGMLGISITLIILIET